MHRLNRCTGWDLNNTLQDVHPDQLCPLWTTANLVFEKILCLQRNTNRVLSDKHFPFSRIQKIISKLSPNPTLALSKLRICPWKAAGLFRAATQKVSFAKFAARYCSLRSQEFFITYARWGFHGLSSNERSYLRGMMPWSTSCSRVRRCWSLNCKTKNKKGKKQGEKKKMTQIRKVNEVTEEFDSHPQRQFYFKWNKMTQRII